MARMPFDRFEPLHELGRGSCGVVWLVRRRTDRRQLALKTVELPPLSCDEKKAAIRHQALREADILKSIKSPHLVLCVEVILTPATVQRPAELHIVTEFCNGGDLASHIKKQRGRLPERHLWDFVASILAGLSELHERLILHRDLKPANVFLKKVRSRPGELGLRALLGDLGLARELTSSQPLACTMVGSPVYCAPELFEGELYGEKADMYSFGVLVYELMHGRTPHGDANNLGALVRRVVTATVSDLPMDPRYSIGLRRITGACLSRSPAERPASAELMRAHFTPTEVSRATSAPRSVELRRRYGADLEGRPRAKSAPRSTDTLASADVAPDSNADELGDRGARSSSEFVTSLKVVHGSTEEPLGRRLQDVDVASPGGEVRAMSAPRSRGQLGSAKCLHEESRARSVPRLKFQPPRRGGSQSAAPSNEAPPSVLEDSTPSPEALPSSPPSSLARAPPAATPRPLSAPPQSRRSPPAVEPAKDASASGSTTDSPSRMSAFTGRVCDVAEGADAGTQSSGPPASRRAWSADKPLEERALERSPSEHAHELEGAAHDEHAESVFSLAGEESSSTSAALAVVQNPHTSGCTGSHAFDAELLQRTPVQRGGRSDRGRTRAVATGRVAVIHSGVCRRAWSADSLWEKRSVKREPGEHIQSLEGAARHEHHESDSLSAGEGGAKRTVPQPESVQDPHRPGRASSNVSQLPVLAPECDVARRRQQGTPVQRRARPERGPTQAVARPQQAYAAQAQACWTKWRREKREKGLGAWGVAASPARAGPAEVFSLQQGLEIRGVAPSPRVRSQNRLVGASAVKATAIYTSRRRGSLHCGRTRWKPPYFATSVSVARHVDAVFLGTLAGKSSSPHRCVDDCWWSTAARDRLPGPLPSVRTPTRATLSGCPFDAN